jgi:L-ascorbate metabolism protein UlaG (beta-lactamase superfamily)
MRLADRLGRGKGRLRWLDRLSRPASANLKPDLSDWQHRELAAAWIGHATVLLRIAGTTILTDPVLGNRVGIGLGLMTAGPGRLVAPALSLNELPPVDVVLVSHAHYDHLDRPTLARLPRETPIVLARHTRDLVADLGFTDITELDWGQQRRLGDLVIRATEVNHWGARTFHDTYRHCCAFVIEGGGRRILFGGDSAFGPHFRRVGHVDLAVLGIGAYNPWVAGHATPEQAWQMAEDVKADAILPMHHSTFRLSREPMAEPIERLLAIAGRSRSRIVVTQVGGTWHGT